MFWGSMDSYEFVDFKKAPPQAAELTRWKAAFGGWPVNRQGQTFRKHKAEFEALEESEVVNFLSAYASMIKRPVVEHDGKVVAFGFDEAGLQLVLVAKPRE
jgi:arsenate reductase